jgi:hypothetical protein
MKKNREDEPIGVITHMNMEIAQENSLCSSLYLKQAKMSLFFPFLFFFSSIKSENRRVKQVLSGGLVPVGGGRWQEKGVGG